jgi:opacity protein-like surface antigen
MKIAIAAAAALLATAAHGADFGSVGSLTQDEFRSLTQELGAAFSYKGVTPATALGVLGVDVGVEVTDTRIDNSQVFSRAGAGSVSDIVVPKLHIYKGLPAGFDVGAFIGGATQVDATLVGADLRYALLNDTITTPAIALRLAGTRASGLGDLKVWTGSLDAMISKRFTLFTPYAGGGIVRTHASADNSALSDESTNQGRGFIGANLNLVAANVAVEAERMGSNTSLSVKLGFRF